MTIENRVQGAWIIHHMDKLQDFKNAANDYETINLAGRCGLLLSSLAASDEQFISNEKLITLAKAINISSKGELPVLINELEKQKLIISHPEGLYILGLTTATTLEYTTSIFYNNNPENHEVAVIDLSERTSEFPVDEQTAREYLSDTYKIDKYKTNSILDASINIGFLDAEKLDSSIKILFNGNLFKRDEIKKINIVCSSLSNSEINHMREVDELLKNQGCVSIDIAYQILSPKTFRKLHSIGIYDVNTINNEKGNFQFVTKPAAFSKFGNAAVEDAFDLAKAFVTSLTFGMTQSTMIRGKITMIQRLMQKLIDGEWVGPATAIGQDYKILELRGVVQVKPSQQYSNRFEMKLLKKDVGELALKVINSGDISTEAIINLPSVSITGYTGPERNRTYERKIEDPQVQHNVGELLDKLRTGW